MHAPRRNARSLLQPTGTGIGGHALLREDRNSKSITLSGTGQTHVRERARKAIDLIDRTLSPTEIIELVFNESLARRRRGR